VAVFARAVIPGKTKTRLIPALGAEGATSFHQALVSDTLGKVAGLKGKTARYLFTSGGRLPKQMVPPAFDCRLQQGRDLAERLQRAFTQLLRRHSRVVIIGTDSPALAPSILRLALEELRSVDAVLGPCPDGGYYLIGVRRTCRGLFSGLRLGTEFAFHDTLASLLEHGFSCSVLEPCPDVDRPADLATLKNFLANNPAARRLAPQTWRFLSKFG
jgi:rSAM/selenodomain-associated transferase 1